MRRSVYDSMVACTLVLVSVARRGLRSLFYFFTLLGVWSSFEMLCAFLVALLVFFVSL